jgi:hypothetical protein
MALRKVKSKKFKTKGEATTWAKKQKARFKMRGSVKWETNYIGKDGIPLKWEAIIYSE